MADAEPPDSGQRGWGIAKVDREYRGPQIAHGRE